MKRDPLKPDPDDVNSGPWWRHRWPWLLMLGPAAAVLGCAVTIVLAFQAYGDQPIVDGGSQHGLVVMPAADGARGAG